VVDFAGLRRCGSRPSWWSPPSSGPVAASRPSPGREPRRRRRALPRAPISSGVPRLAKLAAAALILLCHKVC